ncbi:uncharacterized protein LOC144178178 isoform X2 [Haemaphysalis longicornis]
MTTPLALPTPPALPTTLLPPPKPLDTSRDGWLGWKTWKSKFQLFSTATQLNKQPKEVQAATLLVTIGEEARKAYASFKFEPGEDTSDVNLIIQKFEDFYKPAKNLTYHEFCFGSRDQKEDESFNDWLVELRTLAKHCDFGDLEERMLRSRIIFGIRDKSLQKKLISENPSYQRVVEMCRIQEQGEEQFRQIRGTIEGAETAAVNALDRVSKPCSKCGYKIHRSGRCPAIAKACKKCGGLNHFAQACALSSFLRSEDSRRKEIRELHVDERSDFFLDALTVGALASDQWTATVCVEGRPMVCKLDTGANCCVISKQDVLSLPKKTHQACRATLTSFFGHKTTAQFKVKLSLSVNDKQHDETFFVIEQNVPVTLSGAAAETLGLIYRIDSVETQPLYPAAQPFADVFTGLGQLKNFEYDMKLKPGAAGVVVPARRVPVAIEEKVKAELQRMEEQNVITKVTEPTEWSSYMVAVVKGDKVRICLDPTELNKVMLCEHYPMPVLEEVAQRLSGAKCFSTLDAASGLWQIKLSDSSSKFCTMSTPYGRYRFLRMPFGIASAPEIFQAAMHRLLEGLSGVAVVMDDILVWGTTKEEHDNNLTGVLARCREHNLRLNSQKCAFLQEQVRYLGHAFTTQGLSLDPDRVQAILDMPAPSNTSERRLEELRAATANDPALSTVRSYAETEWPENNEDVPASARPYWAYREEMHAQDGLVFRSNKRLMGRQTRTLLPVPSCHLKPSPLPSREVHTRLQDMRHKQRVYYNRGARDLRTLSPGQRASVYDTHTRTWSPVVVLGSAGAPRSVLVKTEDGREMRRTREHLREVPELPCPDTTPTPSSGLPDSGPVPEPPLPRRSSRERREPRRYPLPERS